MATFFATPNLNTVLRLQQWGVAPLIFLFFLRGSRGVWVEVTPPPVRKSLSERPRDKRQDKVAARPARTATKSKRKQLYLRIIEPPQHEGQTFDLDDELTIGRSPGCGVPTPDDIYTSTLHARLFRKTDQLWVEDL